ncbi:hypothetical protein KRX51_03315 [Corynebacterium sp. TAE3-ERU12]|uniref:hypothetical protein n=1 Tax=Corynebacterium sp. TAE3-ERU12 TaxID=2849491 RepID=UPI001C4420D3|nr:hypothetical protein [Corynebacterium sp. TAE3-ERU12]MBV7294947.1 hypothetical protein [Corynebacterium sp. TAE3-ERU12]
MSGVEVRATPAELRNLAILARRAEGLDGGALLRVQPREGTAPRVFTTTPFGPFACRTIAIETDDPSVCVRADAVSAAVQAADPEASVVQCGGAVAPWPGVLPPADGFTLLDMVPASVVVDLDDKAQAEARTINTPLGPPAALLDQEVLTVSNDEGLRAAVTTREIFALRRMGFVPDNPQSNEPVRISARGRWLRLDGRYGSVFSGGGFGISVI